MLHHHHYTAGPAYPSPTPLVERRSVDRSESGGSGKKFYGTIRTPGADPIYLSTTAVSSAKARSNFIAQYAQMKNMSTAAMFRAIAQMGTQFNIEISQKES